jgi:hypothetical protein
MKSFVEKAIQVEKLKTELVAAEVNLDTERNLLIAKYGLISMSSTIYL